MPSSWRVCGWDGCTPYTLHVLFCEVGTDTPLPTSPCWGEESGSLPQRGRVGVGARGANFVKQYTYTLHPIPYARAAAR